MLYIKFSFGGFNLILDCNFDDDDKIKKFSELCYQKANL